MDRVVEAIVQTVTQDLNFNRCSVYLLNKTNHKLECKYITGFSPETENYVKERPFDIKKHDCIETRVAVTGEPVLVKNFSSSDNLTDLDRRVTTRMGRGCTLYVPLKIKGDIIGILGVDKKHGEPEINEKEFESLSILANYASIIIENSKLLQDLMNEKKFSENVLNSSINGILTVDITGRITSLNPAVEKMFGMMKDTLINRFIWEIFPLPEWIECTRKAVFHLHNMKGMEFTLNPDDKILNVTTSHIMNEGESLIGFMFLIQDITGERKRDEYLQRVNRLISLGELAAGIAHEIRNPLTGIGVVLDFLSRKKLPRRDLELINEANGEIERLEKLISDLLTFARPKKFNFELADIRNIINSIYLLINEQCNHRGIKMFIRIDDDIDGLYVDQERIRQGLLNIVINAIKAMPSGGNLTIKAAELTGDSGSGDPERRIEITIGDTGVGIATENIGRIFDPFFTTNNEGTGLGLSITHSIIKEHSGIVKVDSELGKGTEFTIILPCDCRKAVEYLDA
ncbi:MAG TPA: ATP-binding protein [Syntrophales bacterium]|nr:ATP-binding protein [Syntrophales bacterium]HPN08622.1 ATP-binding protein [Syntrophales bacterium]HPX80781.1 ATP-binding protein [Syntrophales bacterium]HQB14438.1 ATP-binding protein [Syntrophales bacterium]HQK78522.1 ATP-binding protein [Syntrophales bacterium]